MTIESITTIASVCIAMMSLAYTWYKERLQKTQTTARDFKQKVASSVKNVKRMRSLMLQPYFDMHPTFVDVDTDFLDAIKTRDEVWRQFYLSYQKALGKILEENLRDCYMDLSAYNPSLVTTFKSHIQLIDLIYKMVFDLCNSNWQEKLLFWKGRERIAKPAEIGNLLRGEFYIHEILFESLTDIVIEELEKLCLDISKLNDKALTKKRLKVSLPLPPETNKLIEQVKIKNPNLETILDKKIVAYKNNFRRIIMHRNHAHSDFVLCQESIRCKKTNTDLWNEANIDSSMKSVISTISQNLKVESKSKSNNYDVCLHCSSLNIEKTNNEINKCHICNGYGLLELPNRE